MPSIAVVTSRKKKVDDEDESDYSNPPAKINRNAFSYVASGKTGQNEGCKSCFYFDAAQSECEIFEMLTFALPDAFNLDRSVAPNAGCNAHIALKKEEY